MTSYELAPRARMDLRLIWGYSKDKWGTRQADRYIRQITAGFAYLAEDPRRGRSCDEIRAGYFRHTIGSHVIFYHPTASGLRVVRVLHGNMDFDRHL